MPTFGSSHFAFLDHPLPLAFAHRGGALEAEENTMAAFEHAARLGFRYLETDVQASRDGVAVVFHDRTLDRMTGLRGRIGELSWAELSRFRSRGGNRLPRLDDLLGSFPEMRVNIDPKGNAAVEPMVDAIRRCGATRRVCVGSFDQRRTLEARRLLGEELCWSPSHAGIARIWLAGCGLPLGAAGFPVVQVPPRYRGVPIVTRRFVAAAHARGVQVHVWTVDVEAEMDSLIDLGVDGLMTDRPSVLKAVLTRRGLWNED